MIDLMLVAAGALTGLVVGLTGVGGGALMTPLLLLIFGVAPLTAVGTDLWFAALTKLAASRIHHGNGLIDWQVVRRLWLGSLPASALTLIGIRLHPVDQSAVEFLTLALACTVLLTAVGMLVQKHLHALGKRFRLDHERDFKTWQPLLTVLAGVLLGIMVTLTSVGAGAIGAVLLAYLYPLRLTPPRLIATDVVHAIPLAVFAGLGHLLIGNVNFGLLANLLLGSIPAVIVGALLSTRLPHGLLRMLLSVVLLAVAAKMLARVLF
ncbi:sulfite exporter TauE/SafE family protein [Permianibacter sp. IMCC34836]|uniref:sulfite exporter TauE/SafE family protein n=1 Tax=Permianibacter fluminis TaxID=2738515 RepID=UPI001554B640|nr:sulfite exporter TauE/SafE family protein [Permianibacter fluminis]NQD37425.1 sulfite exporter TauE/SafE family protein [Permianibacter fluminis]